MSVLEIRCDAGFSSHLPTGAAAGNRHPKDAMSGEQATTKKKKKKGKGDPVTKGAFALA
jgi:hypothetical protein